MTVLSVQNLSKSFAGRKVLQDISFEVPAKSVFGLVGANGAGKTTIMKLITGLIKADEGQIEVCGEQVRFGASASNHLLGYLPEVPEFYAYMRADEYLALCARIAGLDRMAAGRRIEELLASIGLAGNRQKIRTFSRGMKQRLGIAQALLGRPRLLLCDEPTSALDPAGRQEILTILDQIKQETTVVFSSHILSDVIRICDRVAVLSQGQLVLDSQLADLKLQQKTRSLTLEYANEVDPALILQVLTEHDLAPAGYTAGEETIESLLLKVAK